MSLHILFVDDEVMVLQAIRRSLRSLSLDWDVHFSSSLAESLDILEAHPIDMVITDMQMPGTDGRAFLAHVHARFPGTIRMVLSGFKSRDAAIRTYSAHRFLSKPVLVTHLVEHIGAVAAHLPDEPAMRLLVNGTTNLLSGRSTLENLRSMLADSGTRMADISPVVKTDPALAIKVLQLGNSGVLGVRPPGADIGACLLALGIDSLRELVNEGGLARTLSDGDPREARLETLLHHARDAAARLALDDDDPAAHLGGLIHVAGALMALDTGTAEETDVSCEHGRNFETGLALLRIWALPSGVVDAAASVHDIPIAAKQRS